MSSFRRRLIMSFEKKYTPVKYLESTGTQYIDTGIKVSSSLTINSEFYIKVLDSDVKALFGARNNDYSKSFAFWLINTNIRADYGNQLNTYTFSNSKVGEAQIIFNKNEVNYNNEKHIFNNEIYNSDYTVAIFTCNNAGIFDDRRSSVKLYFFKVYDNDILVRDYIPVLDSSNRPCLYDKVEDKFYYNEGSGEFLYE